MQILLFILMMSTSSTLLGQEGSHEKTVYISIDEAREIAKRDGYHLTSTTLDSNQWVVIYSKVVGYTKGNNPVSKNVLTRIDAKTGKVKKRSRFNSMHFNDHDIGLPAENVFKKKKKMKVWGERKVVYHN